MATIVICSTRERMTKTMDDFIFKRGDILVRVNRRGHIVLTEYGEVKFRNKQTNPIVGDGDNVISEEYFRKLFEC